MQGVDTGCLHVVKNQKMVVDYEVGVLPNVNYGHRIILEGTGFFFRSNMITY